MRVRQPHLMILLLAITHVSSAIIFANNFVNLLCRHFRVGGYVRSSASRNLSDLDHLIKGLNISSTSLVESCITSSTIPPNDFARTPVFMREM